MWTVLRIGGLAGGVAAAGFFVYLVAYGAVIEVILVVGLAIGIAFCVSFAAAATRPTTCRSCSRN